MIDFEKFSRYSRPGPRYTSYPTAVEFHEGFDTAVYESYLRDQDSNRPISLYVHLPFCRSACYFCGCNVVYTSKEEKKVRYISYLKKELALLKEHLDTNRVVSQMHFGGGTPTFFSPEQIREIIACFKEVFPNFSTEAEIGCEIDPRHFSREHMQALKEAGFNRLSFGVQDFDPKVQEAVHRVQGYDLTKSCMDIAREFGINSINIDLIYGLPFQNLKTFSNTLEKVLKLNPDRLAVFNYAHVPWMKKTMRKIDETTLPHPSEKLKIHQHTIEFFTGNGYNMIGMDHFAKPEDELFKAIEKGELHRNFQGYTTKGGADMIGVGITSIGEGERYYAQNHKEMAPYEAALDAGKLPVMRGIELSDDDVLRKSVIMEMMSNFSLNIPRVEEQFKINFKEYFTTELQVLQEFVEAELLEIREEGIEVNPTGAMLIRNIVMPFDAYLKKLPESQRRFSKTV